MSAVNLVMAREPLPETATAALKRRPAVFGSTPAERHAAATLLSEVAAGGALTNPAAMTDESINRQVAAAQQLNAAAGGDERRIANAIAEARR
ncbi:hypothetical protein [Streptomyces sp. NPDC007346]|uniref:hypothetical protein n=1 Tax=Streptomyces sp. NPDC007346 TaxID=3154682 RepID=UPI0034521E4B